MSHSRSQRLARAGLVSLFVVYFAAGLAFSVIFPLGEGPDEPAHFAYVQFVGEHRALPVMRPQLAESDTPEASQAPGYYLLAALFAQAFAHEEVELGLNPAFSFTDRQVPVPTFYPLPAHHFPWKDPYLGWHTARCVSLALGGLTLWLTYRTSSLVFRRRWPSVAAVAFLALNPQFIYLHSIVSNDALATAAGSLVVFTALQIHYAPRLRSFALAGASLALAALAKLSALLLLPGLLYALIRGWLSLHTRRERLAAAFSVLVIPLAASGWWYARNLRLYGDVTGMSVARQANAANYYPEPLTAPAYLSMLPTMFRQTWQSTWALFGWLSFAFPSWIYLGLLAAHLVAVIGLLGGLRRVGLLQPVVLTCMLSVGGVIGGFLYYNIGTNSSGWHGRFLFPAISVLALGMVAGWRRLLGRHDATLTGFVSIAGVALLAGAIGWVVLPAYLPPPTLSPDSPIPNTVNATYEQGLQLVGYEMAPRKTRPGEPVRLTLYWRAGPSMPDYYLEVDALAPDGTLMVPRTRLHTPLRYPVKIWPQDRIVVQTETIPTSSAVRQIAGNIRLYVVEGFQTSRRVQVIADEDRPVSDYVRLGQIGLGGPEQPGRPAKTLLAEFGGHEIALLGFQPSGTTAGPGDELSISLRWQALQEPMADYQVFVQCLDGSGQLVTQHDGPPRMGLYPTSAWSPGEVVVDTHSVTIPETYEGTLQLTVGLYRLDSMERLTVTDAQGHEYPERALLVGTVAVTR